MHQRRTVLLGIEYFLLLLCCGAIVVFDAERQEVERRARAAESAALLRLDASRCDRGREARRHCARPVLTECSKQGSPPTLLMSA